MSKIYIIPVCSRCNSKIYNLHIESSFLESSSRLIFPVSRFEPPECPNCHMTIGKIETDDISGTAIVKE